MISSAHRPMMMVCFTGIVALTGCANPGPPKPPSLNIPAVVTDLKAARYGDTVDLQFTIPERTSDGVALRSGRVSARLCRASGAGICQPLAGSAGFTLTGTPKVLGMMKDVLPAGLSSGPPHLLTYRVEFFGAAGKSAGYSNAAYSASGSAPRAVEDFRAEGSRLGVLLRWKQDDPDAKVLVFREDLSQKPARADVVRSAAPPPSKHGKFDVGQAHPPKVQPTLVTLDASNPGDLPQNMSLDTSALPETPYRYTPERRRALVVDGHTMDVWSDVSPAITFTLHDTFPPPAPTGLSAAGFAETNAQGGNGKYAVDLIWEPVQDQQLAGYKVYREEINAQGMVSNASGTQTLTPTPIPLPAFHDPTASGSKRYRYAVTAVDLKGNESEAVAVILEPQSP